ncbi:MAG: squalene--hopene cyclase, partial [Nitrospirales bacterium]
MDLFKNLLGRLSDSFFSSVPAGFNPRSRNRKSPSLKLVSDNPNPEPASETSQDRSTHSTVGHAESLEEALQRSETWLLRQQDPVEGFWVEELEADTTLTSEYLMLRRYLGLVDTERETKAVRYLQHTQLEDGGWPIYNGGPL